MSSKKFISYSLITFFLIALLEGALRKWFFPSLSTPIFFAKYLIIIAVSTLHFFSTRSFFNFPKDFPSQVIHFFIFFCLLSFINTSLLFDARVGVIGLILYLAFIPITFFLPMAINSYQGLIRIMYFLVFIFLGIYILGIVQYLSPPGAFINKYVSEDAHIATVGGAVRITTVFSYIGGHGTFITYTLPLLAVLLLYLNRFSKFLIIVILLAFGLGLLNMLMSGSRSVVGKSLFTMVLLFGFELFRQKNLRLIMKRLLVVMIFFPFITFFTLTQTEVGNSALENFIYRVETSDNVSDRIANSTNPFAYAKQAGLLGFGIGTTYQGAGQFMNYKTYMPRSFEAEQQRIVLELGIFGFLLLSFLRLVIIFFAVNLYLRVEEPFLKSLALLLTLRMLPVLFGLGGMTVFNWLENLLFWTSLGLLFVIHQIHEKYAQGNHIPSCTAARAS